MRRAIVCDRNGAALFDLPPADVFEMVIREEVNGEHSLTVTTTRVLEKGWRILTQDGRGYWREHVVFGTDALHDAGERAFGTYYCTWSLQHDLMGTRVSEMPGVTTPCTAATALDAALSGTSRWARGTVTNTATGGASMYDTDGWSAIAVMVGTWGGEVDAAIEVDDITRSVTSREVDYYDAQGDQDAKRRYDFGADLSSVRRTVEDGPLYCRMAPRGKGEETANGGYGRKITIASVNDGKDYLENASMTDLAKLPDGNGGWEYPTVIVENSECETPADLKAWALTVLDDYTVPKITYEVDVAQLAREGADLHGVSLGDAVHVVDRKFGDGLRVSARVVAATTNLLDEADVQLTLGHIAGGLAGVMSGFGEQLATVSETVRAMNGGNYSTADYLERLVDRINTEINATGGYAYIVPGNGILTFDAAVADPLNPVEASQVVEIKGGTIRIANTKTAQGAWEWKTVFTSGHVAAELVTAAQLVTGYIGNANGTYWDLDNNLLHLPATTIMDDTTLGDIANQEIGGTNLLDDTNAPSLTKVAAAYNRYIESSSVTGYTSTIESVSNPPVSGIEYGQHLVKTSGTAFHSVAYYTGGDAAYIKAVKPGQTYTMSVYARNVSAVSNCVLLFQYAYKATGATSASYVNKSMTMENDTAWHRYSWTFTTPANMQDIGIIAYPGGIRSETCNTWFCGWKLEAGEKATDWSISTTDAVYPNTMIRAYGSGVLVCKQGNTVGALVNSNGSFDVVKVTWSGTTPTASTVYSSYGTTCQIGQDGQQKLVVDSNGFGFYVGASNVLIGGLVQESDSKSYYTFGSRKSGSATGNKSVALGQTVTASGAYSLAFGMNSVASAQNAVAGAGCTASGINAFAMGGTASGQGSVTFGQSNTASGIYSVAIGDSCKANNRCDCAIGNSNTASGTYSVAIGQSNTASGSYAFAQGNNTKAGYSYQAVFGKYNSNSSSNLLEVGNGTSSSKANAFRVTTSNTAYVGSTQVTSDRRVKTPLGEITEAEAIEFVRQLKPSKFEKFGRNELGFYAQDVEGTNLGEYLVDKSNDHGYEDFRNLSYDGLIAPLTAYAQSLERRIEQLEAAYNSGANVEAEERD